MKVSISLVLLLVLTATQIGQTQEDIEVELPKVKLDTIPIETSIVMAEPANLDYYYNQIEKEFVKAEELVLEIEEIRSRPIIQEVEEVKDTVAVKRKGFIKRMIEKIK